MKYKRYKLDNSAIIFPSVKTKDWTAMFRLSVSLKEEIEIDILNAALKRVLKRLPAFSTTLKRGFFAYYLEEIDGVPPIEKDVKYPTESLDIKANNGFLFRVRYDKNTLAIEYFHSLTDGTGGLTFLLTIIKEYLSIKYGIECDENKYLLNMNVSFTKDEFKDDFHTYARKTNVKLSNEVSYVPSGKVVPSGEIRILSAEVDTADIRELARKYGVTIGVLLNSIILYSYYINQIKEHKQLPIKLSVPVNLRNYYSSKTLCNFMTFVTPGITDFSKEYQFIDVLNVVKDFFENTFTEEYVNQQFAKMVDIENNVFAKYIPLFIKNPIMRLIYVKRNNLFSSTFSNLGNIVLPKQMDEYVENIDFMLGQASIPKSIGACISYKNKTRIHFSRTIEEAKIEEVFFETLEKLGLKVTPKER